MHVELVLLSCTYCGITRVNILMLTVGHKKYTGVIGTCKISTVAVIKDSNAYGV